MFVQTPQVFDFDLLRGALKKAELEDYAVTDDASAVEYMGMKVKIVEGDERNIKVTTPMDLKIAKLLLEDLATNVDWRAWGIEVVFCERNGSHALKRLSREYVDIILTDIRKPLFAVLAKNGWPLIGSEAANANLEDVFLDISGGKCLVDHRCHR